MDRDTIKKRIKIAKILTVFQKTCNNKKDIDTVQKLTLDFNLNNLNNLNNLKSEDLTTILNTLLPISTEIEAQINPKDENKKSIEQCLNEDMTKKTHCLDNTKQTELETINKNDNCPPTTNGGKKSKRSKQRKNNRKSKKQRKNKRR
jgi:hypothetical protein